MQWNYDLLLFFMLYNTWLIIWRWFEQCHRNCTYMHISHNVMQLNQEIKSAEDALQFCVTVTTSDDVPCDASDREQLLKYAIQNEIMSTSKIDSYSGNPLNIFLFHLTIAIP